MMVIPIDDIIFIIIALRDGKFDVPVSPVRCFHHFYRSLLGKDKQKQRFIDIPYFMNLLKMFFRFVKIIRQYNSDCNQLVSRLSGCFL